MKKSVLYAFLLVVNIGFADVHLPSVFSNHMVLQQQENVKIWGWANPDETVTISPSWASQSYSIKASNQAYWEIEIETPKAGGPFTLTVSGNNTITLSDVYIGEVWFCSGQSNMEMSADWGIENADEAIQAATNTNIRIFTTPKMASDAPQNLVDAVWEVNTPEVMKRSSAVAYFFAKQLTETYKNVPVGIIVSAWGGTPAEIWTPKQIVENDANLKAEADLLTEVPYGPIKPGRAYNTMIHPFVNYKIAGVLWYQGEANVGAKYYDKTLSALIDSWRVEWQQEFPFYIVQIAPYKYENSTYSAVAIRDAQRRVALNLKKVELAVISDVSTVGDIHPPDKKSVGIRLANMALQKHYGEKIGLVEGPVLSDVALEKERVRITFGNGEGLYFSEGKTSSLFELAGEDGKFYTAKAKIKSNMVVVTSRKVKHPKYLRYAWGDATVSDLFNTADLPASSFKIEL